MGYALDLLYSGCAPALAKCFLNVCLQIGKKWIQTDSIRSPLCLDASFPLNLGELLQVDVYSKFLLGHGLERARLLEASSYIVEYCRKCPWDDQSQAQYLNAVRMAISAGYPDKARELFSKRSKFRWHADEYAVLATLLEHFVGVFPVRQKPVLQAFESYFNKVRDPLFRPKVFMVTKIARFELGFIFAKYFYTASGDPDPKQVIDLISR